MKLRAAGILFLFPMLCCAQEGFRTIDYAHSSVSFEIRNAGINVDGNFKEYSAQVQFNPEDLSTTRIEGRIKTRSVNTGITGRDNHLRKEEFFHVDKYPDIVFRSTSIKREASGSYILVGKLTIKNTTKEVSLPMSIERSGNTEIVQAKLSINRLDFQVGEKSWIMSDEVRINIKIVTK